MSYPDPERIYRDPAIYTPRDLLEYRRRIGSELGASPKGIVFTYQASGLQHILSLEDGLRNHYVEEGLYPLRSKDDEVGVFLSGFGASHAAVMMEVLIERGSRRFLNIGVAGSLREDLNIGNIVICNRAIRDEGVSHHYMECGEDVYLSADLTKKLKGVLSRHGLSFTVGATWTTDALFRETQRKVDRNREKGALTVEMETAALAAVAKHQGVEIAAAFVITDSLAGGIWRAGFDSEKVVESLKKLHEASLDVFNNHK